MIYTYILVKIYPESSEKIIKEKKEHIGKISVVICELDIVVRVQIQDTTKLLKVTDMIQVIKRVKKKTTQVIEKEIVL